MKKKTSKWRLNSEFPNKAICFLHVAFSSILILTGMVLGDCQPKKDFLAQHWDNNLPNPIPVDHLNPDNCRSCHASQWEEYKGSIHFKSMESGVLWQLQSMDHLARKDCYQCHSPFPEQTNYWNDYLDNPNNYNTAGNPHFSQRQGIVCATCHIRGSNFYGPTLSGNASPGYKGAIPHNLNIRKEFEDEKFCIKCHVTPREGKKVSGKYLMDIYEDWKTTQFSSDKQDGSSYRTCQNCHMPGREHSWKGIHDRDFVRGAVDFRFDSGSSVLEIFNHGVGHKFPAYSVPRIEIRVVDARGITRFQKFLGWKLDIFLKKELEDSRILANETRKILIPRFKERGHKIIVFIHPRAHYENSFKYTFENLALNQWEIKELGKAIRSIDKSTYILWEKTIN